MKVALAIVPVCAVAGTLLADCRELRIELQAFYPKDGQFSGPVKYPRQKANCDCNLITHNFALLQAA